MPFLPFADSMFNADITVRHLAYTKSARGGITPVPPAGTEYKAIVAPAKMSYGEARKVPEGSTPYDVYLAYDADDTLIPSLISGDEVAWGSKTLTLSGPAIHYNDEGVLWWLQCWCVE
jgi:hypothetical protein